MSQQSNRPKKKSVNTIVGRSSQRLNFQQLNPTQKLAYYLRRHPISRTELDLQRINELTKDNPFFKSLQFTQDNLNKLLQYLKYQSFREGETIYSDLNGNINMNRFYIVHEGCVLIQTGKKGYAEQMSPRTKAKRLNLLFQNPNNNNPIDTIINMDFGNINWTSSITLIEGQTFGRILITEDDIDIDKQIARCLSDCNLLYLEENTFVQLFRAEEENRKLKIMMAFKNVNIFQEVRIKSLKQFIGKSKTVKLIKGQYLWKIGDYPEAFFFLLEGQIRIQQYINDSDNVVDQSMEDLKDLQKRSLHQKRISIIEVIDSEIILGLEDIYNQRSRSMEAVCVSQEATLMSFKSSVFNYFVDSNQLQNEVEDFIEYKDAIYNQLKKEKLKFREENKPYLSQNILSPIQGKMQQRMQRIISNKSEKKIQQRKIDNFVNFSQKDSASNNNSMKQKQSGQNLQQQDGSSITYKQLKQSQNELNQIIIKSIKKKQIYCQKNKRVKLFIESTLKDKFEEIKLHNSKRKLEQYTIQNTSFENKNQIQSSRIDILKTCSPPMTASNLSLTVRSNTNQRNVIKSNYIQSPTKTCIREIKSRDYLSNIIQHQINQSQHQRLAFDVQNQTNLQTQFSPPRNTLFVQESFQDQTPQQSDKNINQNQSTCFKQSIRHNILKNQILVLKSQFIMPQPIQEQFNSKKMTMQEKFNNKQKNLLKLKQLIQQQRGLQLTNYQKHFLETTIKSNEGHQNTEMIIDQ